MRKRTEYADEVARHFVDRLVAEGMDFDRDGEQYKATIRAIENLPYYNTRLKKAILKELQRRSFRT